MKKTFITNMPDHVGAFLKASRTMAQLGLNITRVSYNKAVDTHMLFIEAEGDAAQLEKTSRRLEEIGYLQSVSRLERVLLLEFRLDDHPGSVTPVLEVIQRYGFNISYISSQEDGSGWQLFKMGLFVEHPERFARFLNEASQLWPIRVIDYDKTEKILDNSIFYISFVNELAQRMELPEETRTDLLINANRLMHQLDERDEPFHKTFQFIGGFGEALARYRGGRFHPRITKYSLGPELHLTLIEPPCGSNTCILRCRSRYLFVDTGYACYRQEMLALFRQLIPDFDRCQKAAFVTHADVDHCGLLDLFPQVYMSRKSRDSLVLERQTGGGIREQNPSHAPYIQICKTLTSYFPPDSSRLRAVGECLSGEQETPLCYIGEWSFDNLTFALYEGQGGHLPGELVLVEKNHRLAFTGDILINIHELTPEQSEYNRYAPYLMTSVDTNPDLCARERRSLPGILGPGVWNLFGGHGPRMVVRYE